MLFAFISCSTRPKTTGSFRLVMGNQALVAQTAGGAYVQAIDVSTGKEAIYIIDSSNTATIPYGTYNLLFVTFAGPDKNSGTMMCGGLNNTLFNSPEVTLTISIGTTDCSSSIYTKIILNLKQGIIPKWNLDIWDLSQWGP